MEQRMVQQVRRLLAHPMPEHMTPEHMTPEEAARVLAHPGAPASEHVLSARSVRTLQSQEARETADEAPVAFDFRELDTAEDVAGFVEDAPDDPASPE